jgi:thioredoxin reductase (NADPH)
MYLSRYAKKVTMLIRGDTLAATLSHYLVDRITNTTNIEVLFHAQVTGLLGDTSLHQIEITNCRDGSAQKIDTRRLFVCIGGVPNTEWAKDTNIIRDKAGYLVTGSDLLKEGRPPECWTLDRDPFFLETSFPGSFAAGDVRHGSVKRVASAVGEGAMAVTFVHRYLEETA